MKKLLAIAVVLAVGSSAFGSRARVAALQNAKHIVDVQTVFTRPSDLVALPESVSLNFGAGSTVGSDADGGMLKAMGESRLGFFVGQVDQTRSGSYLGVENPFSIAYGGKAGDVQWAALLSFANSSKKSAAVGATDDQKQSYMNLAGSAVIGDVTAGAILGLGDTATGNGTSETVKYTDAPLTVFGQYSMGDWLTYASYMMDTTKDDSSGTSIKTDKTDIKIGAINSMKKEGADFFYGISYEMGTTKVGTVKTDKSRLPVLIGIEADAASWLTLRGSVKQNVLVGSDKTTETDSAPHDTTVAAGAGFKFNKAVLDVTLTAAGTGNLSSNLGGNAGLTYLF